MKNKIVTHPGKAHFDEFFAISLLLAAHPEINFTIERREPLPDELEDPNVWVIDIGSQYNPELHNFDHHQDLALGSSFCLVANHLQLTEILKYNPWWEYQDRLDRFGPYQLARELGIVDLVQTFSAFEKFFLTLFEDSPIMTQQIMKMFGLKLLEQAEVFQENFRFWQNCEQVTIKDRIVLVGLTDDTTAAQEFRDSMETPAQISITYDSRGEGWKMYRFNDNKEIDFSRIENHKHVIFAHKGGFIAKTAKRIPLDEVFLIIEQAIVDEE